jgi:Ca2+-binding RTX toxin-like protein
MSTINLTGNYGTTPYRVSGLASGTVIDAETASWIESNSGSGSNDYPFQVVKSPNVVIDGGTINGQIDQTSDWRTVYNDGNSAAVRTEDTPNVVIRDWRITNTWDAVRVSWNSPNFLIEDVWVTNARDDAVENDRLQTGTIRDSLFDGVFGGISIDPSSASPVDGSNQTVTVDGVLMRMKSYLYEGEMTHSAMIKTDSATNGTVTPHLVFTNNVFAIEDVNHHSYRSMLDAWAHTTTSSNNFLLNLSDTPLPDDYPMPPKGWTVIQGQAARDYWDHAKAEWIANHEGDGGATVPPPDGSTGTPTTPDDTTPPGSDTTGKTITGTQLDDSKLIGTAAADTISGLGGRDHLYGGAGNDTLFGGAGNDAMRGDAGADTMFGGLGNDDYYVDNVNDVVSETTTRGVDDGGNDRVYSTVSYTLSPFLERLVLEESAGAISATGNAQVNSIVGNSNANLISGGGGKDTLTGGLGAASFVVGPANAANTVTIPDFAAADKIGITASDYGLSQGHGLVDNGSGALALDPTWFATGTQGTVAGHGQFLYNTSTRSVMWDADGSGAGTGIALAKLQTGAVVTASNFAISGATGTAVVGDIGDGTSATTARTTATPTILVDTTASGSDTTGTTTGSSPSTNGTPATTGGTIAEGTTNSPDPTSGGGHHLAQILGLWTPGGASGSPDSESGGLGNHWQQAFAAATASAPGGDWHQHYAEHFW